MLRFLLILIIIFNFNLKAFGKNKYYGEGQFIISNFDIDHLMNYMEPTGGEAPWRFFIAVEDGKSIWTSSWYCPMGQGCMEGSLSENKKSCERAMRKWYKKNQNISKKNVECFLFARKSRIVWDNYQDLDRKLYQMKSSWTKDKLKDRLKELGFYGSLNKTNIENGKKKENPKIVKKKETKKITKKYELSGERSIALSWEGYEQLIAGIVTFNEVDYKGTLNLPLPNNDGSCDGSYLLQQGGKGTWQISCTNNMGAAGTLKWTKNGGVTGSGRDYNNKKVKFTVAKKS